MRTSHKYTLHEMRCRIITIVRPAMPTSSYRLSAFFAVRVDLGHAIQQLEKPVGGDLRLGVIRGEGARLTHRESSENDSHQNPKKI